MGCDYIVLIQVLHNSNWVTIQRFGTKTSCGGYPLCNAMRDFLKQSGEKGDYGTQYSILDLKVDASTVIIAGHKSSENDVFGGPLPPEKNEDDDEDEVEVEVVDNAPKSDDSGPIEAVSVAQSSEFISSDQDETVCEEVDEDENDPQEVEDTKSPYYFDAIKYHKEQVRNYEQQYVYFSRSQFKELTALVQNTRGDAEGESPNLYQRLLNPVPLWCDMALSSLLPNPAGEEIWMSDDKESIENVTADFKRGQEELVKKYKQFMANTIANSRLPREIIDLIVEYSMPRGADVRVAVRDDEGQMSLVRQGDLSEPQGGCCIM